MKDSPKWHDVDLTGVIMEMSPKFTLKDGIYAIRVSSPV